MMLNLHARIGLVSSFSGLFVADNRKPEKAVRQYVTAEAVEVAKRQITVHIPQSTAFLRKAGAVERRDSSAGSCPGSE